MTFFWQVDLTNISYEHYDWYINPGWYFFSKIELVHWGTKERRQIPMQVKKPAHDQNFIVTYEDR